MTHHVVNLRCARINLVSGRQQGGK